jgi:ketosteroid isomerase-like protein
LKGLVSRRDGHYGTILESVPDSGDGIVSERVSRENLEAAERIYAARHRGDLEALLAELHPDVEWRTHLTALGGGSVRGHSGVRDYLASLSEEWEDFRQELEQLFDAGDEVVAFLNTYGRGRASGVEVQPRVAHVLRFRDGKCVESTTYLDRMEALRAAGLL